MKCDYPGALIPIRQGQFGDLLHGKDADSLVLMADFEVARVATRNPGMDDQDRATRQDFYTTQHIKQRTNVSTVPSTQFLSHLAGKAFLRSLPLLQSAAR